MLPLPAPNTDHNRNTTFLNGGKWTGRGHAKAAGTATSCSPAQWDGALPVPRLPFSTAATIVAFAAALCFVNSLGGDFVFDDSEAIVNNEDLLPHTPWWNTFRNDFWGTRLTHNTSHKSYRPLTVLSFRLNYILSGGLHPWGFHLTNVLLHAAVSVLSLRVFYVVLGSGLPFAFGRPSSPPAGSRAAFLCALLFAVHPIHTESVAGVVGRADLLCAFFFFLSFLVYAHGCSSGDEGCRSQLTVVAGSMVLCAVSMLCKEQGITAIGICSAYDVCVVCRIDFAEILGFSQTISIKGRMPSRPNSPVPYKERMRPFLLRHLILLMSGILMLTARWHIMGSAPPIFQKVDNPASFAGSLYERIINYNYVYSLNAWLLIYPLWLCFDWSMGCVPLIRSALDIRIVAVLIFWLVLGALLFNILAKSPSRHTRSLTMALALLIVPFLPASNLFFRVGFVIAERVLYIPSTGFCLLVVLGFRKLSIHLGKPRTTQLCIIMLVLIFTLRCLQRNREWQSEEILFRSGIKVCPLNAKVHYNIAKNAADAGNRDLAIKEYREAIRLNPVYDQAMNNLANILKDQGLLEEAEELLKTAISLRSDFAAAWMNLGIVQSSLKKHEAAEKSYLTAISHRKRYPDCYYNLGNLYLEQRRYDEAYKAWRNATRLKPTHTVAWNNMIIMLDSTGDLEKAEAVALEALQILPHEPSLHFNLANALGKAGHYHDSEQHFLEAIHLNSNNPTYHTNLGVLYHRWKKYEKAEMAYRQALQLNPAMKSARENLELLLRTVAKQPRST